MKRIRWSAAAADDLESIRNYLQEHHPSYTSSTIRRIYDAVRSLRRMPYRGRVGQLPGTRELVLAPLPYLIVYGVEAEAVNVFRIVHGARNR